MSEKERKKSQNGIPIYLFIYFLLLLSLQFLRAGTVILSQIVAL